MEPRKLLTHIHKVDELLFENKNDEDKISVCKDYFDSLSVPEQVEAIYDAAAYLNIIKGTVKYLSVQLQAAELTPEEKSKLLKCMDALYFGLYQ